MPTEHYGENRPRHRRQITAFLGVLSSGEALRLLGHDAGPERLAFELCRVWFDRIYVPSGTYLDGIRGDISREDVAAFWSEFDGVEMAALERFHRFFELRMTRVAPELLDAGRIPLDDRWQALTKDAGYLLDDLGVDAEELRGRLLDRLGTSRGGGNPLDFILPEGSARDR